MSNGSGRINRVDRPTNSDRINSENDGGITFLNLAGHFIEGIILTAGAKEVILPHKLKTVPKGRFIVRQFGTATVVDGDTAWTDKVLSLKAIGSGQTTITIFVMR